MVEGYKPQNFSFFRRSENQCNIGIKAFDKLGELGFTFFLGADIPIYLIRLIEPDVINWNCYIFCSIKFVLAVALSYVITKWCEKPLLAWGKRLEESL